MTSTVDNICANINNRFDSLKELFNIYSEYDLKEDDNTNTEQALSRLSKLLNIYTTETLPMLNDFYTAITDIDKKESHTRFVKTFHSSNIVGELDRLYSLYKRLKKIYKINDANIDKLSKVYELNIVDESFENTKSDICPKCVIPYSVEEKTAEYICKNCGKLEKICGVVFEDEQFFYQEGQRTKHCKYDPIKHAKCWIDRLQAREMTLIPSDVINSIKACIKRDELWINDVSCETIRGYLKQLKKTNFNNHVVLIRRRVTEIEPTQLTEHEVQLVCMYVSIVIQIYISITQDKKPNCPYYPFFLYKILEQILSKPRDATRRRGVLSCFHLQSRDTLIKNDRLWFSICDHIPEFKKLATYKKTTKNRARNKKH